MEELMWCYAATLLLLTMSRIGCILTIAFDIVCMAVCTQQCQVSWKKAVTRLAILIWIKVLA